MTKRLTPKSLARAARWWVVGVVLVALLLAIATLAMPSLWSVLLRGGNA